MIQNHDTIYLCIYTRVTAESDGEIHAIKPGLLILGVEVRAPPKYPK